MNILIVEDEERVADFLRRGLMAEGWSVEHVSDGETALEVVDTQSVDVVLLDLMLPGIQGQDVCRKLRARRRSVPILMLSALDSTDERIAGLKLGADDYLPKPFDFDELVARIEALHRRASGVYADAETGQISVGSLHFDRESFEASIDGAPLDLSGKERDLFVLFLSNPNRVLSRERILNAVWGVTSDPMTNIVDVYVGRLRRKLGQESRRIVTLRNVGYRLDAAR
ncbi:response regulator transcription factor [Jannaschia aquimarina]|uniref:ArlR protein n=1 Tax=Jannaschia aquimarina TaxID=935700 RepID=A0A0D1D3S9_9RHOB|nr:response regulator transcription factor [Jannaschia aquimarina]KIT14753.1 Response regulator ArlR [Jannaschia aquimarina]SNS76183.1 DNA-binding response regulator, OmpR family, contains REC and winged-helix (wHTH) domain [Jannaschia aquimarina]